MRNSKITVVLAFAFLLLPAFLVLLVACGNKGANSTPTPVSVTPAVAVFTGDASCQECHEKEFKTHQNSRHVRALRFVTEADMKQDMPTTGKVPNTRYQWEKKADGSYGWGYVEEPTETMHLAFGSGKSGIAFLGVKDGKGMAEGHLSYYPPLRRWFVTPGQAGLPPDTLGNFIKKEGAMQCLTCHTVTFPHDTLMPEKKFMGVGCESCHGAGSVHIDAMRRKDKAADDLAKLETWGASKLNNMCGRCHRTVREVIANNLDRKDTDKYQTYGVSISKCFKKSGDKLSCVVCHDPHTDTPQNSAKTYNDACARCHSEPKTVLTKPRLMETKLCPVNKTGNCIQCHMPIKERSLFPGSPRRIADHFIHIQGKEGNAYDLNNFKEIP